MEAFLWHFKVRSVTYESLVSTIFQRSAMLMVLYVVSNNGRNFTYNSVASEIRVKTEGCNESMLWVGFFLARYATGAYKNCLSLTNVNFDVVIFHHRKTCLVSASDS